ncbi:MAG: cation transporter [Spirochaetales bacterium]|nr:cation transporter [Spirochaetales bacterium]
MNVNHDDHQNYCHDEDENHWHNHDHDHNGIGHSHGASENIKIAFWLNFAFTIIEIIGGLYTNSVAILSDAVHDLGDSVTLLFSLLMEKLSKKKGNSFLTYGYKRYSLLGAFFSSVVLIVGSTFILYNAFNRIVSVEEVNAPGMLIISFAGIFFNGLAVLRLRKDGSLNSKVVFMHMLEDVLGWVSIMIVSIILIFIDLPILDPILSIAISIFVLSRIVPTFIKIGRIFLQYKPDDIEIKEIKKLIEALDDITEIHDVHLWSLDGSNHIFSCHAVIKDELSTTDEMAIIRTVKEKLASHGINHSTIEIELENSDCSPCDQG